MLSISNDTSLDFKKNYLIAYQRIFSVQNWNSFISFEGYANGSTADICSLVLIFKFKKN